MKSQLESLEELSEFAKQLLPKLQPGMIYLLNGEMGVGKTTLVRAIMEQIDFFDVTSPSYTLVNVYESSPPVYHIDLYRCESEASLDSIDLDYYFSSTDHIIFVEWATRLHDFPWEHVTINLKRLGGKTRIIECDL